MRRPSPPIPYSPLPFFSSFFLPDPAFQRRALILHLISLMGPFSSWTGEAREHFWRFPTHTTFLLFLLLVPLSRTSLFINVPPLIAACPSASLTLISTLYSKPLRDETTRQGNVETDSPGQPRSQFPLAGYICV